MPPENAPARVVLIEDHTMVRQMLGTFVRDDLRLELAADCRTVAEGAVALARIHPDLAIVDWMLPDGRGFDLVRKVGPKLTRTRWLFISSNEQGHLVREAVSLGIQGFVMKHSPVNILREAVQSVLSGETYYCPASARLLVDRMVGESHVAGVGLSPRECEILRGFARGENPKALADRLGVSSKTVQNHLSLVKQKLGLQEPADLVRYAIKHGYIESP